MLIAYVALLRGINVSGHKKIKMADLTLLLTELGFTEVSTYIQSGNIVFLASEQQQDELEIIIKEAIKTQYSFDVPVIVLNKEQFRLVHDNIPLKQFNVSDIVEEGSRVGISFLSKQPTPEASDKLLSYVIEPEKLIITHKTVYLHCPQGFGKTKLSNNFFENKLKVSATTRNWKTVVKINQMLNTIQSG